MEQINSVLSGIVMPAVLLFAGIVFAARLRFFFILHPVQYVRTLKEASQGEGISPARALTQALAGTLGVGNMAGVATAITAGGAGSIFWMIVSAAVGMSVKYTEVALGVIHRRKKDGGYYGGAMYYIKDIFSAYVPGPAPVFGGVFAVLCVFNTLITGNIVQMEAALEALPTVPPLIIGGTVAAAAFAVACGRASKVSGATMFLIPILSAGYLAVSLTVIIMNMGSVPGVFSEMLSSAFSLRRAAGGAGGYLMSEAVRYGVTRGIFSNEAGMGSSPSAHASAHTKSPHHQGCFGIFEVFADTVVMCTVTALVILLSDGAERGLDGIGLTLYAYTSLAGKAAGGFIAVSVVLFAFATVICSMQYGKTALGYFTEKPLVRRIYYVLSAAATVAGTVIDPGVMWQTADMSVSLMTALNVVCLFFGFGEIKLPKKVKKTAIRAKSLDLRE